MAAVALLVALQLGFRRCDGYVRLVCRKWSIGEPGVFFDAPGRHELDALRFCVAEAGQFDEIALECCACHIQDVVSFDFRIQVIVHLHRGRKAVDVLALALFPDVVGEAADKLDVIAEWGEVQFAGGVVEDDCTKVWASNS